MFGIRMNAKDITAMHTANAVHKWVTSNCIVIWRWWWVKNDVKNEYEDILSVRKKYGKKNQVSTNPIPSSNEAIPDVDTSPNHLTLGMS